MPAIQVLWEPTLELGVVDTYRVLKPDGSILTASLVPVFAGDPPAWRDAVFIEYFSDTVFRRIRNMGYQAVRTERYKYIEYYELQGMDELYDLDGYRPKIRHVMGKPMFLY